LVLHQYCGLHIGTAEALYRRSTIGTQRRPCFGSGQAIFNALQHSAATLTEGGTAYKWLGILLRPLNTTAGLVVFDGHKSFNGKVLVPRGNLVFVLRLGAQTAPSTMSMTWAEVSM